MKARWCPATAFTSGRRLAPLDLGAETSDVYVYDRGRREVVLISQLSADAEVQQIQADQPSISGDGRYVAFRTTAYRMGGAADPDAEVEALVPDVYLCDRDPDGDGDFDELLPDGSRDYVCAFAGIKTITDGVRSATGTPRLSRNGRTVAWEYRPGGDNQFTPDVQVKMTLLSTGPDRGLRLIRDDVVPAAGSSLTRARSPLVSANGEIVLMLVDNGTDFPITGDLVAVSGRGAQRQEHLISVEQSGAAQDFVLADFTMSDDAWKTCRPCNGT